MNKTQKTNKTIHIQKTPNITIYIEYKNQIDVYKSQMYINENKINSCTICMNQTHDIWTIASWHTRLSYQNMGYGKENLRTLINFIKEHDNAPAEIKYVWDGDNKYVKNWLNQFNPVCKENNQENDWDKYTFTIDTKAFMEYIERK